MSACARCPRPLSAVFCFIVVLPRGRLAYLAARRDRVVGEASRAPAIGRPRGAPARAARQAERGSPRRRTARRTGHRPARSPDSRRAVGDRKSTRLNSSHLVISYAVFCLKKKKNNTEIFCVSIRIDISQ